MFQMIFLWSYVRNKFHQKSLFTLFIIFSLCMVAQDFNILNE